MCESIISRMYVVEPGKIYAGPIPSSPEPDEIAKVLEHPINKWGVRCFINLMEENETNQQGQSFNSYIEAAKAINAEVQMLRLPIRDYTAPTSEFMKKILDAVDAEIANDRPVYVHCWGGLGRTGVVVGCWLRRHGEKDPLKKLQELRAMASNSHRESPQSEDQYSLIRSWSSGL